MTLTLEAKLIIRCQGPMYNPCGREFEVFQYVDLSIVKLDPIRALPHGWGFIGSEQKILCPLCLKAYIDRFLDNCEPNYLENLLNKKGQV